MKALHKNGVRSSQATTIQPEVVCADCPANARCHSTSLAAQVANVLAERTPSLVRAMRIEALLSHPPFPNPA